MTEKEISRELREKYKNKRNIRKNKLKMRYNTATKLVNELARTREKLELLEELAGNQMLTVVLEPKYGNLEAVTHFQVELSPVHLPDLYRFDGRYFIYFGQRGTNTFVYRERTIKDAPNEGSTLSGQGPAENGLQTDSGQVREAEPNEGSGHIPERDVQDRCE